MQGLCKVSFGVTEVKVQDENLNITFSLMIIRDKISAYVICEHFSLNSVKMPLHSFHEGGACFTHILLLTSFASIAVYQIGPLASHIFLTRVFHTSVSAFDGAIYI